MSNRIIVVIKHSISFIENCCPLRHAERTTDRTRMACSLALAFIVVLLMQACSETPKETQLKSPSIFLPEDAYTDDVAAFGDIDGDGEEEFIFLDEDETSGISIPQVAAVSEGDITIKWPHDPQDPGLTANRLLAGNLDQDPQVETLAYCSSHHPCDGSRGIRVLDWQPEGLVEYSVLDAPIQAVALLDVDRDGVQEIAVAVEQESDESASKAPRVSLSILRFATENVETLYTVEFFCDVRSMLASDLDGDGVDEIMVAEESDDGSVEGRIMIYAFSPTHGIEPAMKEPSEAVGLHFMRMFEYDGQSYLFLEYGDSFWKAVYKPQRHSDRTYELAMVELLEPRLWAAAVRSTMAYSKSRNQFLRIGEEGTLDWQPIHNK